MSSLKKAVLACRLSGKGWKKVVELIAKSEKVNRELVIEIIKQVRGF